MRPEALLPVARRGAKVGAPGKGATKVTDGAEALHKGLRGARTGSADLDRGRGS
ncbi:hypothetical protein [Streptomyces uncialis]|uniref:hypothetical protein n=1 Tax=Streptomyces uncialis TaxID=1048205 RepID=UPI0033DDF7DE